ncbi:MULTISPECIES: hypothetical protein [Metallosphaera]|uniref:hypothetical protein n=2 Tax=Metallosphaera TaxID=41980 RepID=UPI001F051120|nr:hypothetical protein [Metallosphaera sedula]MCH1771931.1 hypothetical protein [Metallosphaera sedula]MCP6728547.1 hypothetical protein [Metallosphaera sedula]
MRVASSLFVLFFLACSLTCSSCVGVLKYTVNLATSTIENGGPYNTFSQISPTRMVADNEGRIFVAAVNTVFVLSPNGSVVKNINVSGAEYMAFNNRTNIVYVTSGTLPIHTITEISDANLSVIRQLTVSAYPLALATDPTTGKVFIAIGNEVYALNSTKLVPLFNFLGVPTDMVVSPSGNILVSAYNFTENKGYIFMNFQGRTNSLELNTFPNSLLLKGNEILVGTDGYILEINLTLNIVGNISLYGSKIEGIAYDSNNDLVYAAVDSLYGQDYVLVLNNLSPAGEINVGITPVDIVFDPVSNYVFVSNFFDGTVAIISQGCPTQVNSSVSLPIIRSPTVSPQVPVISSFLPFYVTFVLLALFSALILRKYISKNRGE